MAKAVVKTNKGVTINGVQSISISTEDMIETVKEVLKGLKTAGDEKVIKEKGYTRYIMQLKIRLNSLQEALTVWTEIGEPMVQNLTKNQEVYEAVGKWLNDLNSYTTTILIANVKSPFRWRSTIQENLSDFCSALQSYEVDLRSLHHKDQLTGLVKDNRNDIKGLQEKHQELQNQLEQNVRESAQTQEKYEKDTKELEEKNNELERQLKQNRRDLEESIRRGIRDESAKTQEKYENDIKEQQEKNEELSKQYRHGLEEFRTELAKIHEQYQKEMKEQRERNEELERKLEQYQHGVEETIRAESAKMKDEVDIQVDQVKRMLNQAHPSVDPQM